MHQISTLEPRFPKGQGQQFQCVSRYIRLRKSFYMSLAPFFSSNQDPAIVAMCLDFKKPYFSGWINAEMDVAEVETKDEFDHCSLDNVCSFHDMRHIVCCIVYAPSAGFNNFSNTADCWWSHFQCSRSHHPAHQRLLISATVKTLQLYYLIGLSVFIPGSGRCPFLYIHGRRKLTGL